MTIAASLLEIFSVLPDPRLARGKEHRWSELLFIAVCTLLTGGESFYEMEEFACLREEWLRTFLELPGGPPSHDTFNRLFQTLDGSVAKLPCDPVERVDDLNAGDGFPRSSGGTLPRRSSCWPCVGT